MSNLKANDLGLQLLKDADWDGQKSLIVLNPAGAFASRNWPVEQYASFAKIWLKNYPNAQFLILGVQKIAEKAASRWGSTSWLKQQSLRVPNWQITA